MQNLLKEVERIAKEKYNSQFTILSWANDFKGCYGMLPQNDAMENYILTFWLPSHKTMLELLYHMVHNDEAYVDNNKNMESAKKRWDLSMGAVNYEAGVRIESQKPNFNESNTIFGYGICPNCNNQFKRKSHNHKFCKELCRLEFYEKKTGKDLTRFKKLNKKH